MLLNEKHNAMLYAKTKVLTSRDETLKDISSIDRFGMPMLEKREIFLNFQYIMNVN